jgi:AcrR family transcriptional regulator
MIKTNVWLIDNQNGASMKNDEQNLDAKMRIYKAAITLFAQRGFYAVGVREIAKAANVNISMINYYYNGKIGILKQIITETLNKYYDSMKISGDDSMEMEERALIMIKNMIKFFREDIELAMVTFNSMPFDIPEIVEHKINLSEKNRDRMKWFFENVGGNFNDPVQMGVLSGFLSNIILAHFENKYVWEQVKKTVGESRKIEEKTFDEQLKTCCIDEDDYYNKYAETLAKIYFHGVPSITTISKNKEKK